MSTNKAPFNLIGIEHIVFLVDDMEVALAFYKDFLGCSAGYSYPALGMEQVWAGGALIVLWDITHPGATSAIPPVAGGRNVDHVCIATGPFDEVRFREYCSDNGVDIELEALHGGARGMGNSFYIRDPFGNRLEIKGPAVYPDGTATSS